MKLRSHITISLSFVVMVQFISFTASAGPIIIELDPGDVGSTPTEILHYFDDLNGDALQGQTLMFSFVFADMKTLSIENGGFTIALGFEYDSLFCCKNDITVIEDWLFDENGETVGGANFDFSEENGEMSSVIYLYDSLNNSFGLDNAITFNEFFTWLALPDFLDSSTRIENAFILFSTQPSVPTFPSSEHFIVGGATDIDAPAPASLLILFLGLAGLIVRKKKN